MTNCFGLPLPPDRLRWAVAEGVSEDVICAVLLLHEHSVNEIAPKLRLTELENVIVLVGRNPRLYPPGTLQALESKRAVLPPQPAKAVPRKAVAIDEAEPSTRAFRTGPEGAQSQPAEPSTRAFRTGLEGAQSPPERRAQKAAQRAAKAGTASGTRDETARRRLIVDECRRGGLSIHMIADVTDIPRSSVHRAMGAVARAEARKQVAIAGLAEELLGRKLSRRGRDRP